MLLIGRVVESHRYQNEEDEERPDDLDQQLELETQNIKILEVKRFISYSRVQSIALCLSVSTNCTL